jgi:hypothetical protein
MEFKPEKGIHKQPDFVVVYGNPGLGKSTFASGSPKPIFIDPRNRTRHLDVERVSPTTWEEYLEVVKWAIADKKYQSVVLDEMNFVDELAKEYIWRKYYQKYPSFALAKEKGGQYNVLNEEYKVTLLPLFDAVRNSGKNLIVVAHPEVKDFADPLTTETYIRYQLGLTNGLNSMLKRSCDALFFINKDVSVTTGDNKRAIAGDEIYIFTSYHQSYDAKNSWDLPAKIELKKNVNNWNVFQSLKAVESLEGILKQIEGYIPMFPEDKQTEIRKALKGADLAKLQRIKTNLQEAV